MDELLNQLAKYDYTFKDIMEKLLKPKYIGGIDEIQTNTTTQQPTNRHSSYNIGR